MNSPESINESSINLIAEQTQIDGKISLGEISRVHGVLKGEILAPEGSTLILSETGVIEGTLFADTLLVDGYVRGDIVATKRVTLSRTGRVIGTIKTPSLVVEFGAYFEGTCRMES